MELEESFEAEEEAIADLEAEKKKLIQSKAKLMAEMKTLRLDLKAIKADHKELVEAITEIQSLMEETEGSEVS